MRSGLAYQASAFLSAALAFATYNAYTSAIGLDLLGVADLLLAWLILLAIIARLGFGEAILRHWFTGGDQDRPRLQRTVQLTVFASSTVIALVVTAFAGPLAGLLPEAPATAGASAPQWQDPGLIRLAAFGLWAYCNLDIAQTLLRSRDDRRTYLVASVSNVLLTVGLTVLLVVVLDEGVRGYLLGNYAASLVIVVALWWRERGVLTGRVTELPPYPGGDPLTGEPAPSTAAGRDAAPAGPLDGAQVQVTQETGEGRPIDASLDPSALGVTDSPLESAADRRAASRGRLRPLLRFGLPTIPTDAAIFGFNLLDRTVLAAIGTAGALGIFTGASKIAAGVILIARAFQLAFPPLAYGITDAQAASRVYASALRGYAAVLGATVAGVALAAPWTVHVLIGVPAGQPDLRPGVVESLPLLAAAWALWGVVPVMTTIAGRLGATKLTVPAGLAGLAVNVIGLLLLVPPYGAHGAAAALVIAYVVLIGVLHLLTRRHFPVGFDKPRIIFALALCAVTSLLAGPLADAPELGWGPALIRIAMWLVMVALLVRFALTGDERRELGGLARRLARR